MADGFNPLGSTVEPVSPPVRIAVVAVLLVTALAGAGAVADSHYAITASPSVDTPTREVTFEDQDFTVSALARVDPGGTVSATVDGPSDEEYRVLLYNGDGQIIDRHDGTGASTVSFETAYEEGGTYPPGTYVIVVSHDGVFQVIHPLVVSGYRASVDAPADAEPDDEITITASTATVDDAKAISGLEVVIGNDDRHRREPLEADGSGSYEASIRLDTLGTGSYSLYVVVQGHDEVLDQPEILGVSDPQSFDIVDGTGSTTASPTEGTETATGTRSPDDGTPTATDGTHTGTGGTAETATASASATDSTDRDGTVITPRPTTAPTRTTTPGQPLGLAPVAVAALACLLWWHRRARTG